VRSEPIVFGALESARVPFVEQLKHRCATVHRTLGQSVLSWNRLYFVVVVTIRLGSVRNTWQRCSILRAERRHYRVALILRDAAHQFVEATRRFGSNWRIRVTRISDKTRPGRTDPACSMSMVTRSKSTLSAGKDITTEATEAHGGHGCSLSKETFGLRLAVEISVEVSRHIELPLATGTEDGSRADADKCQQSTARS